MKLNIDKKGYDSKPKGLEIGRIVNKLKSPENIVNLKEYITVHKSFGDDVLDDEFSDHDDLIEDFYVNTVNIEPLKSAIIQGKAITAGELTGTSESGWKSQQLFIFDFDNDAETLAKLRPKDVQDVLLDHKIPILFAYWTFSNTPEHPKFRVVTLCDKVITNPQEAKEIIKGIMSLFPTKEEVNPATGKFKTVSQIDLSCDNLDRIFHGTNQGIIDKIGLMWRFDDVESYIGSTQANPEQNISHSFSKRIPLALYKSSEDGQKKLKQEKNSTKIKPEHKKPTPGRLNLAQEYEKFDVLGYILKTTDSEIIRTNDLNPDWHGNIHRGAGEVLLNPCPICGHNDDFYVNVETNLWFCHSSSSGRVGGNIINYLQLKHDISLSKARDMFKFDILGINKGEDERNWRSEVERKQDVHSLEANGADNVRIENNSYLRSGLWEQIPDEDPLDRMLRLESDVSLKPIVPKTYRRPNNKIAKTMINRLNKGVDFVTVSGAGDEAVKVRFEMRHHDKDCRYTGYDWAVHDGILNLYAVGNLEFTAKMVYRAMNGVTNSCGVGEKALKDVKQSIEKLRKIMIDMDYGQEVAARNKDCKSTYHGPLIDCIDIKARTGLRNGTGTVDAYRLMTEPVIYSYTEVSRQYLSLDVEYFQSKVPVKAGAKTGASGSSDITVIKGHILRQVWDMKKSKSFTYRNGKIAYSTVYGLLGLDRTSGKAYVNRSLKVRKHIDTILQGLVESKYIKGFGHYRANNKPAGVTVSVK